jgi:hypothetical protein
MAARQLAWEEARTFLQAPNPHSIRGMRDRALLGVLVTFSSFRFLGEHVFHSRACESSLSRGGVGHQCPGSRGMRAQDHGAPMPISRWRRCPTKQYAT